MGTKVALCPQGKFQSPYQKAETKLYEILQREIFKLRVKKTKNKHTTTKPLSQFPMEHCLHVLLFLFLLLTSTYILALSFLITLRSVQNGIKRHMELSTFLPCCFPRHALNSCLIVEAWLLISSRVGEDDSWGARSSWVS